jgi:hypothetical protein
MGNATAKYSRENGLNRHIHMLATGLATGLGAAGVAAFIGAVGRRTLTAILTGINRAGCNRGGGLLYRAHLRRRHCLHDNLCGYGRRWIQLHQVNPGYASNVSNYCTADLKELLIIPCFIVGCENHD